MTAAADSVDPPIGGFIALLTYFSWALIVAVGHLRDFLGKISGFSRYEYGKTVVGYSVLLPTFESFYTRRIFHRIQGNIRSILTFHMIMLDTLTSPNPIKQTAGIVRLILLLELT